MNQSDENLQEFLKRVETALCFIEALAGRESDEAKTVGALLSLLANAEEWLNALSESSEAVFAQEYINAAKMLLGERVTTQAWWRAHRALLAAVSYLKSQANSLGELKSDGSQIVQLRRAKLRG